MSGERLFFFCKLRPYDTANDDASQAPGFRVSKKTALQSEGTREAGVPGGTGTKGVWAGAYSRGFDDRGGWPSLQESTVTRMVEASIV